MFIYAKTEGGSLLDISASTDTFPRVSVVQEISDAQGEISDAKPLVSDRQRPTFDQVITARKFLSYCTQIQTYIIEAYSQVVNGRDGVENEREGAIESAVVALEDNTEDATRFLTRIRSETTAEEVSIVPAIPAEDYTAKVAQFDAEISGFEALSGFLESMREAIGELNDAQRFDRVDRERSARESAQRAVEDFERLSREIQTFLDNLSESGASLRELTNSLIEISENKRELASEILEQNS
ncbi:hypothetical protein [Salinigranum rubrum]|nr:hypothetical protein [Salinigranum rubrum]